RPTGCDVGRPRRACRALTGRNSLDSSPGRCPISANLRVTLPPECPGGTPENSPAFQRRGTDHNGISPEGMAEYTPALEAPTTLSAVPLGLVPIQMKPGVETPDYSHKSLRDSRKEFNSVRVIFLKLALMGQRPGWSIKREPSP